MKYPNIRIVQQDSMVVLPDGQVKALARCSDIKALLVLNVEELHPGNIKKLLEEGFYKRRFCDVARIEKSKAHFKQGTNTVNQAEDNAARAFVKAYGNNDFAEQLYKQYEMAGTTERKQRVLEQHYDQAIQKLNLPQIIKQAEEIARNRQLTDEIAVKWKQFSKSSRGGRLATPLRQSVGKIADLLHSMPIPSFVSDGMRKLSLDDVLPYALPDYALTILRDCGVQFVMAENLGRFGGSPTHMGSSNYVMGNIKLNAYCDMETLREEMMHYLDSHVGFSIRPDWIKAVQADGQQTNKNLLSTSGSLKKKASIFDTKHYSEHTIPSEYLVNLHALHEELHVSKSFKKDQFMQQHFPNTYPLYKEFLCSLEELAKAIKNKGLITREQHDIPELKIDHAGRVLEGKRHDNGHQLTR